MRRHHAAVANGLGGSADPQTAAWAVDALLDVGVPFRTLHDAYVSLYAAGPADAAMRLQLLRSLVAGLVLWRGRTTVYGRPHYPPLFSFVVPNILRFGTSKLPKASDVTKLTSKGHQTSRSLRRAN